MSPGGGRERVEEIGLVKAVVQRVERIADYPWIDHLLPLLNCRNQRIDVQGAFYQLAGVKAELVTKHLIVDYAVIQRPHLVTSRLPSVDVSFCPVDPEPVNAE